MILKAIGALTLAAVMICPAIGQDDAKKKKKNARAGNKNAAAQLIKQLEPAGLTDDQVAKVKELGKKAGEEMKKIREAAGITPELNKKRIEAAKSLKDSGKKGKELRAAINEKAGFTAAHAEATKTANAVRANFKKAVTALLTDEQKAKLPKRKQQSDGSDAKKKRQGKKKTDAKL